MELEIDINVNLKNRFIRLFKIFARAFTIFFKKFEDLFQLYKLLISEQHFIKKIVHIMTD